MSYIFPLLAGGDLVLPAAVIMLFLPSSYGHQPLGDSWADQNGSYSPSLSVSFQVVGQVLVLKHITGQNSIVQVRTIIP